MTAPPMPHPRHVRPAANLGLVALALAVVGCGTTVQFARTNSPPRPLVPRHPNQVAVYTSSVPSRPYAEIGLLQARQSSALSVDELPEVIEEMKVRAGEIGCDGVILHGRADAVEGGTYGQAGRVQGSVHTLEGVYGTCVVWTDAVEVSGAPSVADAQPH